MVKTKNYLWQWNDLEVSWSMKSKSTNNQISTLLIHGFGASKEHWRHNQALLGRYSNCYAIDLIGFGNSSQPKARLKGEPKNPKVFNYCFENWANQIKDFCQEVIQTPVLLIGNSIGGVIALRASQLLTDSCKGVILIDCAQRRMDDKRLKDQPYWMTLVRPSLKRVVRQRWLSKSLFRNASNQSVIKKVLKQAYPSGANVDDSLITLLYEPSQREGASEAFHGFINLFDDYLAPQLFRNINVPVDLIWGQNDPWEPLVEAQKWMQSHACIRSLEIIDQAGHCPHDEAPQKVNPLLVKIIQQAT